MSERTDDQQWVESPRELYLDRANRAMADKARVLGDCFICGGVDECPTPAMCGYEVKK